MDSIGVVICDQIAALWLEGSDRVGSFLSPGGGHPFAETGAQVIYFQALREQNPVHRSFRWKGYWACLKDLAPSGAPALAPYCSNPHQTVPPAVCTKTPPSKQFPCGPLAMVSLNFMP